MARYAKGKLALKILYLISAGALIPASIVVPNLPQITVPLLRALAKKIESRPHTIKRSLTALKRNRLIDITTKGDETRFVLAEKGRLRVIRGDFERLGIPVPKRWDKKWRVVIFDIPEQHRRARDALRMKLKDLGFYQLQKSCFVHPFECRDQIDFVSEFFKISHYLNYLVVESLEGGAVLRRYFEL